MMKRFESYGKYLGLALLALGMVFAGCTVGGPSEEGEVSSGAFSSVGIPVSVDYSGSNPSIVIGDGSGEGQVFATADGHTIEVADGDTCTPCSPADSSGCCTDGAGDGKVWIRVYNRDPDEYMSNVYARAHGCPKCTTAQLDQANFVDGDTTGDFSTPCFNSDMEAGNCGVGAGPIPDYLADPTSANFPGYCYVEDGNFATMGEPFNKNACWNHIHKDRTYKPFQVLHPDCGMKSVEWDFGNQAAQYLFYLTVHADYDMWNPTGDGLPGTTTDNDPRYDFEDRTTYYVMLADYDDPTGAPNAGWYRLGSYQRSTVLAGYGAGTSGYSPVEGQYFAANVAIEYPDRMESRIMGDKYAFTNYEYYTTHSAMLRYNPFAVSPLQSDYSVAKGVTLAGGPVNMCADCTALKETYKYNVNVLDSTDYGVEGYLQGWIAITDQWSTSNTFQNYTAAGTVTYYTMYGGNVKMTPWCVAGGSPTWQCVPQVAGQKGVAHIDVDNYTQITYSMMPCSPATGNPGYPCGVQAGFIDQEGPDAAPEWPFRMHFFRANNGASGLGSELWVDMYATISGFILRWTNGTFIPSGTAGGTDDWTMYCWPMDPGLMNDTDQGCGDDSPDRIIHLGLERMNPEITQSGKSTKAYIPGTGAMQQWPVHVCIQ